MHLHSDISKWGVAPFNTVNERMSHLLKDIFTIFINTRSMSNLKFKNIAKEK